MSFPDKHGLYVQARVSAAATISNSETNIRPPLPSSTISLNRSGFINSSGCISFLLAETSRRAGPNLAPIVRSLHWKTTRLRIPADEYPAMAREPPRLGKLRLKRLVGRLVRRFNNSLEASIDPPIAFQNTVQNASLPEPRCCR